MILKSDVDTPPITQEEGQDRALCVNVLFTEQKENAKHACSVYHPFIVNMPYPAAQHSSHKCKLHVW